jgi:hypothetical protein
VIIEAIAKSCPINDDNVNSVVLNLDKSRHFACFLKIKIGLNLKISPLNAEAYISRMELSFLKVF